MVAMRGVLAAPNAKLKVLNTTSTDVEGMISPKLARTTSSSRKHQQGGKETLMELQHGVPNKDLECSMCGDVGFSSELFRCKKCLHRFQHTYCSRFYPNLLEDEVCEWCSLSSGGEGSNPTSTSSTNNTSIMNKDIKPLKIPALKDKGSNGGASHSGSPQHQQQQQLLGKRKPATADAKHLSSTYKNSEPYVDALELLLEVAQVVEDRNYSSNKRLGSKGKIQQSGIKRQRVEDVVASQDEVQVDAAKVQKLEFQQKQQQQKQVIYEVEQRQQKCQKQMKEHQQRQQQFHKQVKEHQPRQQLPKQVKHDDEAQKLVLKQDGEEKLKLKQQIKHEDVVQKRVKQDGEDYNQQQLKQMQKHQNKQKLQQVEELQKQKQKQQQHPEKKQKLQLSTSRSMGRRYKLLSDVLC